MRVLAYVCMWYMGVCTCDMYELILLEIYTPPPPPPPQQCIDMGAIVDPTQRKSIDDHVQQAKKEGADVYQACACMPSHGCFYPPTLITKVQPVSLCVQEEVCVCANTPIYLYR